MVDSGAIVVPTIICHEIKLEIGASNDADGHYERQNVHNHAWARQGVSKVVDCGRQRKLLPLGQRVYIPSPSA